MKTGRVRSVALLSLTGLLLYACGGDDSALEDRIGQLEEAVAEIQAELAATTTMSPTTTTTTSPSTTEAASADIYETVTQYTSPGNVEGDATYVSIEFRPNSLFQQRVRELEEVLNALGFPGSTIARIGNTRALDGTLSANGEGVTAYWSYHPDDGLSIVIERDQ